MSSNNDPPGDVEQANVEAFFSRFMNGLGTIGLIAFLAIMALNYFFGRIPDEVPVSPFTNGRSEQKEETPPMPARPPPADESHRAGNNSPKDETGSVRVQLDTGGTKSRYIDYKIYGDVMTI